MSELPPRPFDWPIIGPRGDTIGWVRVEEEDTVETLQKKAIRLVDEYESLEKIWNAS